MDVDDESLLFRLLAYSLVRHLNLRLDAADAVYFELLSERRLVRAWIDRYGGAGADVRGAISAAARAAIAGPAVATVPLPSRPGTPATIG